MRAPQQHDDDRGYAGGATRRLHASQERNARADGTHAPMSGFVTTRPRFRCAGAWVEWRVGEGRRRTPRPRRGRLERGRLERRWRRRHCWCWSSLLSRRIRLSCALSIRPALLFSTALRTLRTLEEEEDIAENNAENNTANSVKMRIIKRSTTRQNSAVGFLVGCARHRFYCTTGVPSIMRY